MWKIASKLFLVSIIVILSSCTAKRAQMPDYRETDIREVLSSRSGISAIETTFSAVFDRGDTQIRGDGAANLSRNGDMSMRIYSLGFLAFEMTARNGIIQSNPPVDRNKGILLSAGIRDCLFWWDLEDVRIQEDEGIYLLRNTTRSVWIDKKTMLPIKQTVALDDGRELFISYQNPACSGAVWYPSKIRIEIARYMVTLNIREISFISGDQTKINRDRPDNSTVYGIRSGQITFEKGVIADGIDKTRGSLSALEYALNGVIGKYVPIASCNG